MCGWGGGRVGWRAVCEENVAYYYHYNTVYKQDQAYCAGTPEATFFQQHTHTHMHTYTHKIYYMGYYACTHIHTHIHTHRAETETVDYSTQYPWSFGVLSVMMAAGLHPLKDYPEAFDSTGKMKYRSHNYQDLPDPNDVSIVNVLIKALLVGGCVLLYCLVC